MFTSSVETINFQALFLTVDIMSFGGSGSMKSLTLDRRAVDPRKRLLDRERSGSIDQLLYTGKKVSKLPEDFTVKIRPRNHDSEIMDLDLNVETKHSLEQLRLKEKPQLSKKAWNRLSNKRRARISTSGGDDSADGAPPQQGEEKGKPAVLQVPLIIEALDEEQKPQNPLMPLDHTRMSTMSADSGFDDPSQIDREGVTHGIAENCLTATTTDELHRHSSLPVQLRVPHGVGIFDSIRVGTKHHRKSMLLSDLCVVTVSVPTEIAQGQKGRGAVLKFRFSPYTQIEFLRIAILKVGIKPFIYESNLIYWPTKIYVYSSLKLGLYCSGSMRGMIYRYPYSQSCTCADIWR